MATDRIENDLYVSGNIACRTFTPPASSITNAAVIAAAGVDATQVEQRYKPAYAQPHGSAGTTVRQAVHQVIGATGTINSVRAMLSVAPIGAATHVIQIKKNGSNILSTAITLDNANTAFIDETDTGFTSTALVAGDVLEVDVTATAGGGTLGQGLHVMIDLDEDAA